MSVNYGGYVREAVQLLAQPRVFTLGTLRVATFDGAAQSFGVAEDGEVYMTLGLVDLGVEADPAYVATGGIAV